MEDCKECAKISQKYDTKVMVCGNCVKKQVEKSKALTLEYEYIQSQEKVREHIQQCEGRHTQQAVYSTFHDALTQVCYGCMKVRSTIKRT
jgi:hypothetical protein